ncbi:MAG: GldG family protein [Nitrospirae bacterium]|nr:GldG family protein [Nitrospirota bacterium]
MAVAGGGGWTRWAGAIGLIVAVGGVGVDLFWPQRPLVSGALELLAVACLAAYVTAHFQVIRAAAFGRAARLGLHGGLLLLVFLAVIVLVNVLAVRHNLRWDLSGSGQFSLSPQTVKILKGLDRDVTVTLFVQDLGPTKGVLHALVDSYQQYTRRLTVIYVDPEKRPAVAKQYGVTQYDTVVFESGGQESRVRLLGPEDLDNREQLFTNALIRVLRTEKKRIAFLEGHGEHALDDAGQSGFSAVKEGLEREGYEVVGLSLAQQGSVPEKITALVIGGATKFMAPQEMEAVRGYLNKGGRLLVLADPLTATGIEPLLADWGVTLDQDLVIETSISLFGAGLEMVVARTYSKTHVVTREFSLNTAFPAVRSLRFDAAKASTFSHENLVTTSDKSWGETDLKNQQVEFDRLRDLKGPLVLALAVQTAPPQQGQPPPAPAASTPSSAARLVVFGDSDFATNGFFRLYGNGDLLLNVINWLGADEEAISIRPKEANASPLILSDEQEGIFFWVSVVVMPGAALLAGLVAWQWRRRL